MRFVCNNHVPVALGQAIVGGQVGIGGGNNAAAAVVLGVLQCGHFQAKECPRSLHPGINNGLLGCDDQDAVFAPGG